MQRHLTITAGMIQNREKYSDEALMFDLDTPEYAHPVILLLSTAEIPRQPALSCGKNDF